MQPSRRAFLFGRQTPRTPWDAFVQRLGREAQGRVRDLSGTGVNRARLIPVDRGDVRQARALCAEYGVMLRPRWPLPAPDGNDARIARLPDAEDAGGVETGGIHDAAASPFGESGGVSATGHLPFALLDLEASDGRPVLEIDLSNLSTLMRLPQTGQWLAEPGCQVGDLVAAGLPQFRDAPADWCLAVWMATAQGWAAGKTAASGIVDVDVLLSDGTVERLGAFGASGQQPLLSATVQRLVPSLFQLSVSPDAVLCRDEHDWPCRYRLDALLPTAPSEVNLAHLLLGHRGELAWIESITLMPGEADMPHTLPAGAPHSHQATGAARRLQMQMKQAFDPLDLYGG